MESFPKLAKIRDESLWLKHMKQVHSKVWSQNFNLLASLVFFISPVSFQGFRNISLFMDFPLLVGILNNCVSSSPYAGHRAASVPFSLDLLKHPSSCSLLFIVLNLNYNLTISCTQHIWPWSIWGDERGLKLKSLLSRLSLFFCPLSWVAWLACQPESSTVNSKATSGKLGLPLLISTSRNSSEISNFHQVYTIAYQT